VYIRVKSWCGFYWQDIDFCFFLTLQLSIAGETMKRFANFQANKADCFCYDAIHSPELC